MNDTNKFVDMLHNVPWEDGLPKEVVLGKDLFSVRVRVLVSLILFIHYLKLLSCHSIHRGLMQKYRGSRICVEAEVVAFGRQWYLLQ